MQCSFEPASRSHIAGWMNNPGQSPGSRERTAVARISLMLDNTRGNQSLKSSALFRLLISTLLLGTLSFAANITGTITNKTTNKPSSGDDVVLVKLAATMQEEGRTKSDSK